MRINRRILLGLGGFAAIAVLGVAIREQLFATRATSSPPMHLLVDSHCRITLDQRPVDLAQLHQELIRSHRDRPEPELHFQPGPDAPYDCVDRVLTVIKESGVAKLGFIGNEMYTTDDPSGNAATQAP